MLANATRYGVFRKRAEQRSMSSYNPTLPFPPPPPPPPPSTASTLTFSLFFALLLSLRCSTFITSHPMPPTIHPDSSISPPPLLLLDYFRFAFLSFSSPPSLRLSLSLFLCSSLNYWKQNGLKTKTQADVAWLITARRVWHPCQMKTVEKNYYCGRYVTPSPPAISLF